LGDATGTDKAVGFVEVVMYSIISQSFSEHCLYDRNLAVRQVPCFFHRAFPVSSIGLTGSCLIAKARRLVKRF
jgi:hypothetical protein